MGDDTTYVVKAKREFRDFKKLWRQDRLLAIGLALIVLTPVGWNLWLQFGTIPKLISKVDGLTKELEVSEEGRKRAEDTLAPWITLAKQRFPDTDEARRMAILFTNVEESLRIFKTNEAVQLRMIAQIEGLQSENGSLKAAVEWRSIKPIAEQLTKALRAFSGREIVLAAPVSNPEAYAYMAEYEKCFKDAGWIVKGPLLQMMMHDHPGAHLLIKNTNAISQSFIDLYSILIPSGLADAEYRPNQEGDILTLEFGRKPNGLPR